MAFAHLVAHGIDTHSTFRKAAFLGEGETCQHCGNCHESHRGKHGKSFDWEGEETSLGGLAGGEAIDVQSRNQAESKDGKVTTKDEVGRHDRESEVETQDIRWWWRW